MVTPEMVTESATTTFEKLELDCGVTLAPVECAYETYGALNAGRTNAILVLHAFSGDAADGNSHFAGTRDRGESAEYFYTHRQQHP